ncbi:MAG: hypothetical protein GX595_14980, partial [Lentisphaerae bacterium]|nr:hypothetical protein [Lentisphaerota bacterium]
WRVEGATDLVCSSYRTARGDTLVVVGNPTYAPLDGRLAGPPEATAGRQALQIDVLARIGRRTAFTPGYRWEPSPEHLTVPARSLVLAAFVRDPDGLEPFRRQRGFFRVDPVPRREPVPDGWALLADHDDPDWILASDRGTLTATERDPVDSRRALRVEPRPLHASAAIMLEFTEPRDWSGATALSLWIRPDRPYPLQAFDLRLRHRTGYTPAAHRAAPADLKDLPAGVWTQLRYDLEALPRQAVRAVRLYTNRQTLGAGHFDLDEVILEGPDRPADPAAAAAAATATAATPPAAAPTPATAPTPTQAPAAPATPGAAVPD